MTFKVTPVLPTMERRPNPTLPNKRVKAKREHQREFQETLELVMKGKGAIEY